MDAPRAVTAAARSSDTAAHGRAARFPAHLINLRGFPEESTQSPNHQCRNVREPNQRRVSKRNFENVFDSF
jgi:hypothetical protein